MRMRLLVANCRVTKVRVKKVQGICNFVARLQKLLSWCMLALYVSQLYKQYRFCFLLVCTELYSVVFMRRFRVLWLTLAGGDWQRIKCSRPIQISQTCMNPSQCHSLQIRFDTKYALHSRLVNFFGKNASPEVLYITQKLFPLYACFVRSPDLLDNVRCYVKTLNENIAQLKKNNNYTIIMIAC